MHLTWRTVVTPREAQVVAGLLRGLADKQLAHNLGVSPHTLKSHMRAIREKVGAQDRLQVALWAIRNGAALDDIAN